MSFQEAAGQGPVVLFGLRRHGVFPSADLCNGGIISPKLYPMHHVYWSILGLFAQAPRGEVLIREAWLPLYYQSGLPVVSRLADPANNTDAISLTTCARHSSVALRR